MIEKNNRRQVQETTPTKIPNAYLASVTHTAHIFILFTVLTLKNAKEFIVACSELATSDFSRFYNLCGKACFCCTAWLWMHWAVNVDFGGQFCGNLLKWLKSYLFYFDNLNTLINRTSHFMYNSSLESDNNSYNDKI